MAILRRDDWLTTPQGQALAGAEVYYLTQPADTTEFPPSPLATVYSNTGGSPGDNPGTTDGYGHAVAYLADGQLYTIAFYHPLLGDEPLVLTDQSLNGASSGGVTPFAQTPAGEINGTNKTFTLTVSPSTLLIYLYNTTTLVPGVGYTTAIVSGVFTITMAVAPPAGSVLYAFGIL